MTQQCPKCKSTNISTRNTARKIGGSTGTIAGTIGGFSAFIKAARLPHLPFSPHASLLLSLSNALLTAFMSGIAGGGLGIKLGELVDDNILDNYQCNDCGARFSQRPDSDLYLDSSFPSHDDE